EDTAGRVVTKSPEIHRAGGVVGDGVSVDVHAEAIREGHAIVAAAGQREGLGCGGQRRGRTAEGDRFAEVARGGLIHVDRQAVGGNGDRVRDIQVRVGA